MVRGQSRAVGTAFYMAEGVGFEPTVGLTPRSISSRVPSTGLSHPSKMGIAAQPRPPRRSLFRAEKHLQIEPVLVEQAD